MTMKINGFFDSKVCRHSLWLIPDMPEREGLRKLILKNQRRANQPAFSPHITLLGHVEGDDAPFLASAMKMLGRVSRRLTLHCRRPRRGDDYFHCLYIPIVLSTELKRLRSNAERHFRVAAASSFRPHVSLMYHDPHAALTRECEDSLPDLSSWQLNASRLELWMTGGPVNEWVCRMQTDLPENN